MAQFPVSRPQARVSKGDIVELKSLASPPELIVNVLAAVLCLLGHEDRSWKNAKAAILCNPQALLSALQNYDVDNVSARTLRELEPYLLAPGFSPPAVKAKSAAAEALCQWVCDVAAWAQRGSPAQSLSPERPPQARP